MRIQHISEHVWLSNYEERRDRPGLGLIIGERFSVAVDAGHSARHVKDFYNALEREGLDLPELTVLTHWHWDHTFGMHAVHGLTVAENRTEQILSKICDEWDADSDRKYKRMEPSIVEEYGNDKIRVVKPDIAFSDEMTIDAGNLLIRCFHTTAPHTDDSTLIYIPDDHVIFVGDCICGEYPSWEKDAKKLKGLKETLTALDFDQVVSGHWIPFSREELFEELDED